MRYINIPKTDLSVSGFCLGTATFGSIMSREDSFDTLDRFVHYGGNFLDSASLYADWIASAERSASEKTIGRWLKERNAYDKVIVATKGGALHLETNLPTMSDAELSSQMEASRINLGMDTIPLYYLHRDDKRRTVEEIMSFLFDAQDKGKVRYIACSNWTAERIAESNEFAKKCGRDGFVAVSDRWSLAMPIPNTSSDKTLVDMDDKLMALHKETAVAAIPFSSTAQGYLSRVASGENLPEHVTKIYGSERNNEIAKRAAILANEKGVTIAQLALSYFYSEEFTAIPITAFDNEQQMREAVEATEILLTDEEYKFLMGIK